MSGIARMGDLGTGICYLHRVPTPYTTTFISGAPTVTANGLQTAVIGTIGQATCGHATVAMTGSPDVMIENKGAHRLGDMGQNGGPYTVVSCSPDAISN